MPKKEKSDDWLIKNAISCWLYHYPNHPWTDRYKELVKLDTFIDIQRSTRKRSQSRRSKDTNATVGKHES